MVQIKSFLTVKIFITLSLILITSCDADSIVNEEEEQVGNIFGRITDPFDGGLEFAVIELMQGFSTISQTSTDTVGYFNFDNFATGSYQLKATKIGFNSDLSAISIIQNFTAQVNIALDPESLPSAGVLNSVVESLSGADMVFTIDVFVVDESSVANSSLNPSDFEITDLVSNGIFFTQQSVSFQSGSNKGPYSATMLLDQSGSILDTDPNNSRIQASKIFFDALGNGDNAILSAFSSNGFLPISPITIWGSYTNNGSMFFSALDLLPDLVGGGTPLYVSIIEMINFTLQNAPNANKAVIVFTDGENTDGSATIDDIETVSASTGVKVFTIGLSSSVDFRVLAQIAGRSGGAFIWAGDARQLVSLYGTLGDILRGSMSFYRIKWKANLSSGTWGQGGFISHSVNISVPQGTLFVPFLVEI